MHATGPAAPSATARPPRSEAPLPPRELLTRIGRTPDGDALDDFFDRSGRARKRAILRTLPDGYSLEGRRVLDFGCGAGRVLRHFVGEAARTEFWGCDLHAPSIEWLSQNLSPPMRFFVNDERPMPVPDASFDLIYALSVFTHITYEWSDWLMDLHRALKPGGLLLATFMGSATWERAAQRPIDENELGMAVLGLHRQLKDSSGPVVLHSPWWIESRWGRAFDILSIRSEGFVMRGRGHGVVLARKRDADAVAQDLEWPNPADQRELAAQRLQISLLEQNAARLRNQLLRASNLAQRLGDPQALGRKPKAAWRRLRRRAGAVLGRSDAATPEG